jgi:DNA polymerase delta subunit 1
MYCLRPEGGTAIVTMKEFKPFFYMEFPDDYTINTNKKIKLTNYLNQVREYKTCKCDTRCICVRLRMKPTWEWVERRRLYFAHKEKTEEGYKNIKSKFIRVEFPSLELMNIYKQYSRYQIKLEGYPPFRIKIHESEHQLLKFFAWSGLPSIGWVDVYSGKTLPEHKITSDDSNIDEYESSYTDVKAVQDDIILHPKVMTFDIEAYSHVHTAFPNVSDIRDEVFQISIIFTENKKSRKVLLSLGNPNPIEDVVIHTFASEPQLLIGFTKIITTERPNVILGYNSFGFDLRYILRRATPFPDYLKKRNPD